MVLLNPEASALGRANALLWGRGRRHHVADFRGPLSIKTVRRGGGVWETAEGRFDVQGASYLVLNDGQPYTLTIEAKEPVETFCVFFAHGFVEEVRGGLVRSERQLLDDPHEVLESHRFLEALRRKGKGLSAALDSLGQAVLARAEPLVLEERMLLLARALVLAEDGVRGLAARLPPAKAATRLELARRLEQARDFIEGALSEPLTLGRLAREAALSPYHFHRLFCAAFRETPRAYVVRRRLERARRLLATTDQPVTAVCLDAGFSSLGSFSALFSRRFGVSPRAFRRGRN
jgi:AraC-like DNA-binding protein